MSDIGKNIQMFRTKKGISKEALANMLSVDLQIICDFEEGKTEPSIDMLPSLAKALDTDADALCSSAADLEAAMKKRGKYLLLLPVILICGIFLYQLMSSLRTFMQNTFHTGPYVAMGFLVVPTYYAAAGYFSMSLAGCFLHTRPLTCKYVWVVHILLLIALASYYVFIIPSCLSLFIDFPQWGEYFRIPFNFFIIPNNPEILFVLGAALWITHPNKHRALPTL